MGYHFLFQGIFPNQGSNPGLLHCRQILYHLCHLGRLYFLTLFKKFLFIFRCTASLLLHVGFLYLLFADFSLQWLFLCGAQALGHVGSVVVACGIFLDQGSNHYPLHFQDGLATIRSPGKSYTFLLLIVLLKESTSDLLNK